MEIEMMKIQLKEYGWIKEENNNNNNNNDASKKVRKRKRRRKNYYSKQPYCRDCKRYYKNYTVLAAHRRICRKPTENPTIECKPKKQEIPDDEPSDLEVIVAQNDGKIEKFELRPLVSCKDCKLNFATTRELFEHRQHLDCQVSSSRDEESELSDVTDEEYEYDSLYACAVCRAKFISRELLGVHRAREAHWGPVKTKVDLVVVKRELQDFTFRSCEENEYSCTGCSSGRVFYDPDDLLRHHRAAHSSSEIYCRYCCLRLADLGEFNDHHRAYHDLLDYCRVCNDKEEKYEKTGKVPPKPWCLNCSRKLRLPFQDCMSLLKETLYCDDCGRAMPSVGHVQFHNCAKPEFPHELPLPILVCPLCQESFNSLRSLYRHVIKHNDMMSFRCNACGKLHETWKELKAHASRCHASKDIKLPRTNCDALRRNAEDVIRRFVKNGVKLLTN